MASKRVDLPVAGIVIGTRIRTCLVARDIDSAGHSIFFSPYCFCPW